MKNRRQLKQEPASAAGPMQPLAVSVEEAAKAAGVGRTLLYEAIARKELASLKAGRRRIVRVEALNAWLRTLEQRTAA